MSDGTDLRALVGVPVDHEQPRTCACGRSDTDAGAPPCGDHACPCQDGDPCNHDGRDATARIDDPALRHMHVDDCECVDCEEHHDRVVLDRPHPADCPCDAARCRT